MTKKFRKYKTKTPGQERKYDAYVQGRAFQAYEDVDGGAPANNTTGVQNFDPLLGGKKTKVYKRKRRKLDMDGSKIDGRTKTYRQTVKRIKERQERLRDREIKSKLSQMGLEPDLTQTEDEIRTDKPLSHSGKSMLGGISTKKPTVSAKDVEKFKKKNPGKYKVLKPSKKGVPKRKMGPPSAHKMYRPGFKKEEVETPMEDKKYLKTKPGSIEDAAMQSYATETPVNPNSFRPTLHLPQKKYLETKTDSLEKAVTQVVTGEAFVPGSTTDTHTSVGAKQKIKPQYDTDKFYLIAKGGGSVRKISKDEWKKRGKEMRAQGWELAESWEVGTDAYARFTRALTPGQNPDIDIKGKDERKASALVKKTNADKKRQSTRIDDAVDPRVEAEKNRFSNQNDTLKKRHITRLARLKRQNVGEWKEEVDVENMIQFGKPFTVKDEDEKEEDYSLAPQGKGKKGAKALYKKEDHVCDEVHPEESHEEWEKKDIDEAIKWKVKIEGMPAVFIDAKSAGAVKSSLRRMLKKPDTIQSIERITPAEHKKSLRARLKGDDEEEVEEEIEMTETSKDLISMVEKELSTRARDNLSASDFVFPDERSYPIQDESHARNALARVAQHGTPAQKAKVKAAVRRKYPNIKVDEEVEMNEKDSRRTVDAIKAYYRSKDASRDATSDTDKGETEKGDTEKKYAKKERGEIDKDDPKWKHKKGHTGMHGEETEISPLMKATLDELSKNTLGHKPTQFTNPATQKMVGVKDPKTGKVHTKVVGKKDPKYAKHPEHESVEMEAKEGKPHFMSPSLPSPDQQITDPKQLAALHRLKQKKLGKDYDKPKKEDVEVDEGSTKAGSYNKWAREGGQQYSAGNPRQRKHGGVSDPDEKGRDADSVYPDSVSVRAKSAGTAAHRRQRGVKKVPGAKGRATVEEVEMDEASKIRSNLQMIGDIAKNKQAGHITHSGKKTQVDMFTASAVQQVYNVLNKQNQQKMEKMINKDRAGFLKVAKFALSKAR